MTGQPMIAAKATRVDIGTRNRLMSGGAMGMAIGALLLVPQQARAQTTIPGGQAFQGNAQVVSGNATVVQTAAQDTITVNSSQAVINWTPNDRNGTGTIDFLPQGLRGLFQGDADFTVLNRIVPLDGNDMPIARMIALNGIIDSQINSASGLPAQGGSVWFYSPGGILVGGTSVINVGSLLLTSRDIDATGGLFAPDGTIRFRNPSIAGANGAIEIDVLARINARNSVPGSAYVAMVAPRVVQAGTVRSDGAIALVAAEEADIRINRGLFDIVVTTGSSDSNGIVHSGSSTGPSDTSTLFENRAYLVAVPKNQAMTMLLSGTIGFETASSVSIAANGGILLSAGGNVLQGSLVPPTTNNGTANISITDSRFANNIAAIASGAINARPNLSCAPLCSATNPAGQLLFGGNASFAASGGVNISIGQAQRMTVAGSLLMLSARPGQGGTASLTIDNAAPPSISTSGGGLIQVAGAVLIDASAGGNPATGAATGGTATLSINGGRLSAGAISVLAGGSARVGTSGDGADGRGGTAGVNVENGGILNTGALTVAATGRGSGPGRNGQFIPFLAANGGDGIGGTATVVIDNANLSAAQGLTVSANGFGAAGSQSSGNGSGGTASISTDNNGGSTSLIAGSVQVQARGEGGGSGFDQATSTFFTSPSGGDATGGRASFAASDTATSTVTIGFLSVDAGARGGTGSDSSNPPLGSTSGGDALGGIATFALNGTTATASINQITVTAAALGGAANSPSGNAGNGTGGSASMALAAGSNLQSSTSVTISADGSGGEGTDVSGNGIGGSASADFADSASFDTAALRLSASGFAGGAMQAQQSFAPVTTVGGDGTGGIVSVSTAGFLTISDLDLDANGFGGTATPPANPVSPLIGGDATGGSSQFIQTGGFLAAGTVDVRANATAGGSSFPTGTSGAATGGSASFASSAGTVNLTELSIEAIGRALSAGGGTMLAQLGGTAALATTGGLITIDGRATLDASGGSVGGGFADTAALTSGGIVTVDADTGGSIAAGTIDLFANADASGFGRVGGDARGGTITVRTANGSSIATLSGLTATASGSGGTADQGGQGIGGGIDVTADGGSLTNSASIFLSANGESGRSLGDFASPDGRGGAVTIRLTDNDGSQLTFAGVQITADGRIGSGFSTFGPSTPPGGGDGIGGTVNILIEGGTLTGTSFAASASGYGTGGGLGQGGTMNYAQSGGDVTLSFLSIGASGFGGASPFDEDNSDAPGVGGVGQGGTVTLDFTGGTFSADFANAFADGRGGNGHQGFSNLSNGPGGQLNYSGDGGEGNGGSINVTIDGDADVGSNFLSFSAEGSGGNGGNFNAFGSDSSYTPGRGGNGGGGNVTIDLLGGNSTAAEIAAFASGRGGNAGQAFTNDDGVVVFAGPANHPSPDGGNATGGNALIRLAGTTVSGTLSANASASAGEGGSILSGFTGGTGRGGLAEIRIDGVTGLSVPVNIIADGFGGRGGRPNQGEGGDGGDGFGGTARLTAINGADFAFDNSLSSNTDLRASGYGGDGRNARVDNSFAPVATGFDGGDGGDGRAGTIELSAIDSNLAIAAGSGQGTNIGFGGLGGDGASNTAGDPLIPTFGGNGGSGGDGYGGDLRLVAVGGTLSADSLSLQAGGQRADGGRGGFGNVTSTTDPLTGVVTFFGGDGSGGFSGFTFGGSVRLEAGASESGPGLIDVSTLAIDVSGDVGGRAELIDNSSGPGIALGAFTMVNGNNGFSFCGALPLCGSGLYVSSRDGAITIDGNVDLNLVGGFQVDAFGTGGLDVGGNLSVIVGLDIIARHEGREDSATIEANDIVFGGGPIDLQTGTLVRTTSGSIDLTSGSFISFDTLDSALDIFMDAGSTIIGGELVSDSVATARAGGTIDFGRVVAGDFANLVAGGRLRVGELTVTSGNAALTGNGVTLDSADIATTLTVRAQNGDAVIGTVTSGAFADINALQDVSITSLTTTGLGTSGGSSAPTAAIIVNSGGTVTLGSLSSADTISITADLLAQATGASQSIGPGGSSVTAVGAISVGTVQDIDFGTADGAAITLVSTGGDIRFGSATSDIDTRMTATVGSINGTSVTTADGDATLIAGNRIALDNADVGDALSLTAGLGGITLGTSISGYDTLIDSDGNVSIVSATTTDIGATAPTSTANIVIIAAGNVDAASLTSAENITIDAAALTNATSSIVAAGNVDIDVGTAALFGTLTAGSLLVDAGTGITFGSSSTIGSTSLIAGTGIVADSLISSSGGVSASSSGGAIDIGTARAAFDLTVTNSGGAVTLDSAASTQSGIFVDASGAVEILAASSAGQFDVASDADIVIGTATSFGDTILDAGTTITVTSLTTTGQSSSNSSAPTNAAIRLTAGGDVTIGTLDAIGSASIDAANLVMAAGNSEVPATSSIFAGEQISIIVDNDATFSLADAGGDVTIDAPGTVSFASIAADGSAFISARLIAAASSTVDADLNIVIDNDAESALGTLNGGFVTVTSDVGIVFDSITGNNGASLFAQRDIVGGTISAPGGPLSVTSAAGGIAITTATSGGTARFTADSNVTLGSLTVTDGSAFINAGGDIRVDLGTIADAFVASSDGNIDIGALTSGGTSSIDAAGDVLITQLTTTGLGGSQNSSAPAGANILLTADGNVSLGSIDSAERIAIVATNLTGAESSIDAAGLISIDTAGAAQFGTLDGGNGAAITTGSTLTFGSSTTIGSTSISAGDTVTGGALRSEFGVLDVTTSNGSVTLASAYAGRAVDFDIDDDLRITGALTVAAPQSDQVNSALIETGGSVSIDSGDIGGALSVRSGGDVSFANSFAVGGDADVAADGVIAVAGFAATQSTATSSTPALAGNVRLDAGSLLTLNGTTSAQGNVVLLGGDISGAERLVQAGGDITVFGTGTVVLGTLDGGLVSVRSNDSVTFSDILARNGTTIEALQDIDGGSIDTGGNLSVNSAEGSIDLTRVAADIDAAFTAGDGIAIGELVTDFGMATADALGDIRIDNGAVGSIFSAASGGDTVIGELTSGGPASIDAGDAIVITRLTTTGLGGGQNSSAPTSANILLSAGGVVTLGTLDSAAGVVIDASSLSQMGGGETPASSIVAIDDVLVTTAGTADIGSVDAMRLDIDSGGSVSLADSTTQSWTRIRAGGDIDAQDLVSVAASVVAMSATGSIAIDSVQSAGSSSFVASGSVELGSIETEFGSVDIGASNDVDIGTAEIGGSLFVFAGNDATIDTASANGFIIVNAGGEIAAASLTTTGLFVSGTEDLPPVDDDNGGGDPGNGGGSGGGDEGGGDGGDGGGDPGGDPIAFASILLSSSDATTVAALDSAGGIIISADTLGGAASSIAAVDTIDITTRGNALFGTLDGDSNAVISAGGDLTFVDSSTADSTVITTIGTISGRSLESRGSTLTASSAEGNIDIGTIDASQAISLTALSGQVSGDIADSRFGTILIDAATVDYGELESAGTILVRASGDVAIDFAQTNGEGGSSDGEQNRLTGKIAGADALVPPAGSDIIVAAGGSLTTGEFVSAEDIVIDAASLIGANSSMTAEGIIDIDVTGNAEFGSLSASGNRLVVEADGAVTGNLVNTKAADSTMRITGANGITIATIRAADQLNLATPGGRVMVGDLRAEFVDVTGQAIDLTATDSVFIDFAGATAGDVLIRGTAGTLDVNDSQASGSILLRSSNGELLVGRAQASGIDLQSDASIVLRGQAIATQGFAANARNSFTVGGTSAAGAVASGGTVNIVSGDIAIAANGRIGTAGTTTELRLTNGNNGRQTFIGGADTTAGYSLSATELSRLFSGNITVRGSNFTSSAALVSAAPGTATIAPSGNPNVVIDSFTLTGGGASGGNLGAAGSFRIEAPGFARVIGTATLNNLTGDNRFVISAERAVQVIMGQGAIRLNGANGLAGTLLFDADDVVVATASAISEIAALTDSAAIDERLAQNDGVLSDEGALSAGTIAFAVDNGVYVQNSGDGDGFDDRRGFTAGAGGVDIVTRQSTSSQSSPRIVINGRIDDGAGSFLTGVDAFGRVTINEVALTGENQIVSGIDQGSTLNGCLIASASNCFAFEIDVIPPVQNNPLVDEEDEESDQSEGDDSLSVTTVIEVKEVEKLPNEPLIDDPVTGSPNDDLWVPTEG